MQFRAPTYRWAVRSVLALGVLAGAVLAAYFLLPSSVQPGHEPLGRDFAVYYGTAEAFLRGESVVGYQVTVRPGRALSYFYPPVTVLAFAAYPLLLGPARSFAVHTMLNAGAMLGVAALAIHVIERERGRLPTIDRLLLTAFCLLSALSAIAIGLGQIDPFLALAIAIAFVALEAGRPGPAGAAIAAAAVFKIAPGAAGLYFMARGSWRAVGAAVGTGLGIGLASVALFGIDAHLRHLEYVLAARSRIAGFDRSEAPAEFAATLVQPLGAVLPGAPGWLLPLISLGLTVPVLAAVWRRTETVVDRLVVYLAVLVIGLLATPATSYDWVVFAYFPALALLYLLEDRPTRGLMLAGVALLAVPIQRYQPSALASLAGRQAAYDATVGPAVEGVLALGTVPLYGLLLLLVGCAVYGRASWWPTGGVDQATDERSPGD